MEWYVAYLLLGTFAGFIAGLFGVGGGLVLVPLLLLMFDAQHFAPEHIMHLALGTSMATIIFTSLASMRKHHQLDAVNWQVVRHITPGILLGTAIGALTASTIPAKSLGIFFALFVYFAAAQILVNKRPHASRQLPGISGMTAVFPFSCMTDGQVWGSNWTANGEATDRRWSAVGSPTRRSAPPRRRSGCRTCSWW